MEQPQRLRPELWSRLPQVLVHKIIEKVLASLPFSRSLDFCLQCTTWKDFLLSTQPYLLYMHMGHLIAFNPRRSLWESVSLEFCQREGRKFEHLAASNEGLLCLSTTRYVDGELMVCNPLTRAYTMPVSPAGQDDRQSVLYCMGVREASRAAALAGVPRVYWHLAKDYQVHMSVNSATGTFKIIEIYIMKATHPQFKANPSFDRITLTYDSSSTLWKRVTDVSDGICFIASRPTFQYRGYLYFNTIDKLGVFRILYYGVEREQWGTSRAREPRRATCAAEIETSHGNVTLAYSATQFHIAGTGDKITWSQFHRVVQAPLFTDSERHVFRGMKLDINWKTCRGYFFRDGDTFFSVFFLRLTPASPLLVKVWGHNREGDSIALSTWEEWNVPIYGPGFPSPQDFHFFRPSFVLPNNVA